MGSAALTAETLHGGQRGSARFAGSGQGRAALVAELARCGFSAPQEVQVSTGES